MRTASLRRHGGRRQNDAALGMAATAPAAPNSTASVCAALTTTVTTAIAPDAASAGDEPEHAAGSGEMLSRRRVGVAADHPEAGPQQRLRDAEPHRPEPDHGDRIILRWACHAVTHRNAPWPRPRTGSTERVVVARLRPHGTGGNTSNTKDIDTGCLIRPLQTRGGSRVH